MKLFKKILPVFLVLFFLSGTLFAQVQQRQGVDPDDISDQELEKFVDIALKVQPIGQEMEAKLQERVEEEDMKFQRFQQIFISKQNPQAAQDINITEEEEKIFQKLQPEIQKIIEDSQKKQMSVIQESDLTLQRYQQLAQAIQTNPDILKKVQQMMQEETDNNNNQDGN